MDNRTFLLVLSLTTLVLCGCTGYESFSRIARTGDTVALAVGGSPLREINPYVDKNNVLVSITDSGSNTYDLTLQYLFKLYGDPTSKHNYNATYNGISTSAPYYSRLFRDPNQGEWVAVIDLIDPNTGLPPPLTTGDAIITVTSPDLYNALPNYFGIFTDGGLDTIGIEILPGTGTPHAYNGIYGTPDALEALPQLQISFDNSAITVPLGDIADAEIIGGIEFTLDYDEVVFGTLCYIDLGPPIQGDICPPMVRGNINESRIKVSTAQASLSGGNKVIRVLAVAEPDKGIVASPDPNDSLDNFGPYLKYSDIADLKIYVSWDPLLINSVIDAGNFATVFQVSDLKVVDINGQPMIEPIGGGPLTPATVQFLGN